MKKAYAANSIGSPLHTEESFRLKQVGEHAVPLAQIAQAILKGEPIDLKHLPTKLVLDAPQLPETMTRIFPMGSFWAIAPDVAEVFSRFNLGASHIWPLDCSDVGDYTFFGLYIGEGKSSWRPEKSTAKRPGFNGKFLIDSLSLKLGEGSVVLGPEALEGADLWVEQSHSTALAFFSEGLAEALMDLSLTDELPLWECQIDE